MQTIGERLEEARKRKGISIREASEATKIRSDYLQKFESNTFEIGLPDIYVRGFLRTYAQYLKLNAEKLLTDYASLGFGEVRESRRHQEQREIIGRIDLPEAGRPAPTPAAPPPSAPAEPALPRSAPTPRSVPTAVVTGAPSADRRQKLKMPFIVGGAGLALIVLVLVIRAFLSDSSSSSSVTTGGTSTSTPASPANDRNVIRLIALGNVRAKVVQVSDNRVLFDGDLVPTDTRNILRSGPVKVSYDAGKNLQIEVQGQRFRMSVDGEGRNLIPAPGS
ncbi:MAG TPA: helix-turn-helix domain-containing protein [Opitutaceae bacterium]|nr:helix-turn-helix domain-containing protein [Opitutaceae bacterium]